ncbi:MAG: glycosyltransferase family 4 protein [Acidobacteriota bacterium]
MSAPSVPGKRLLIVGNFLSETKVTRGVCEELAARLTEKNWSVVTTSPRIRRFVRLVDMASTAWRQRDRYEVAQVDVFSGAAFFWAEIVCWVLRRAGKPYILTLHGGNLPRFSQRHARRVRRLLASASAVTVPSRYLLEEMKSYREDLRLLPNGIDLQNYGFRLRERPAPRLVWLRAFHEIYNPSMAPRVLALLRKEFPDVRLAMIGPDKKDGSEEAARRVAAELGVADSIDWSSGVAKDRVPEVLERADIFLNTTNFDNSPVTVIEALACGLCVVSTDAGGMPYLLNDGENAILVSCDDAAAMAEAVSRILKNPSLAARLSANGRRLAEDSDWGRVLPEWQRLIGAVQERHVA